jgi:hypothetical protein
LCTAFHPFFIHTIEGFPVNENFGADFDGKVNRLERWQAYAYYGVALCQGGAFRQWLKPHQAILRFWCSEGRAKLCAECCLSFPLTFFLEFICPCCLISGIATGWGSAEQNLPPSILPASDFQGKRISGVECGLHHTFALTDEGTLFSWGKGGGGRLGHGENQTDVYMPYPSFRLQNDTVDSISLGGMHK